MPLLLRIFLSLSLFACSAWSFADHVPKNTHLAAWQRTDRVHHEYKPAATPRLLGEIPLSVQTSEVRKHATAVLERGSRLALILLEKGQIVFEGYANGATKDSRLLSMSVAKSLTALAVGEALCAGKIKSLDDPAQAYAPALTDTAFGRSSVRNLLKMASGASEVDPVLGMIERDYMQVATGRVSLVEYVRNGGVQHTVLGMPIKDGERFAYNGMNTEALTFVIEGATNTSFLKWFEQTILTKARGEAASYWQLDKEGKAVAEAVYIASARDYARIALYVLDRLSGKETADPCITNFLRQATTPQMATSSRWATGYGYQMWMTGNNIPTFAGHGGQFVAFNPKNERALVAFSWKWDQEVIDLINAWIAKE